MIKIKTVLLYPLPTILRKQQWPPRAIEETNLPPRDLDVYVDRRLRQRKRKREDFETVTSPAQCYRLAYGSDADKLKLYNECH